MILGLGTAALGRPEYINIRLEEKEQFDKERFKESGIQVLNEAYNKGIKYYDTAPGYGLAEELLLEWANDKKGIEIATKWGYTYVADFNPDAEQHEIKEHSIEKLNEQWAVSKELLPKLTTYQIHSATLETGVLTNEKVLQRLWELNQEYGIKIGLTTTGENQEEVLKKALEVEVSGNQLFSVYQVTYNLLEQSLGLILPELTNNGHRVIVKEAMANGRLLASKEFGHYAGLQLELNGLAKKYEVGLDAIALRFVQDSVGPFTILSGASTVEHVDSNLKANNFQLTEEEIQKLRDYSISSRDYWLERKNLSWQ